MTENPSSKKGLIAGIAALGVAAIAVVFVLPSEFGIDPTGAGKALGLTDLSEPKLTELELGALRTGVLTATTEPFAADPAQPSDQWVYELAPFDSIEMKYTLDEGGTMLFDWQATAVVKYDMHSHPFDGGTELTESYAVGDAQQQSGKYVAAFSGIHGWYWQNLSSDNVTVTVRASGPLKESTLFSSAGEAKRELVPIETPEAAATPTP